MCASAYAHMHICMYVHMCIHLAPHKMLGHTLFSEFDPLDPRNIYLIRHGLTL